MLSRKPGASMDDLVQFFDPLRDLDGAIRDAGMKAVAGSPDYARAFSSYVSFAAGSGLRCADPETVRLWAEGLKERYAPASVVPMLAGVKKALRAAALAFATAREAAAFSEALRAVKAPKKNTNAVRRSFLLTASEEQAVLAAMSARDASLFRFLVATGCRISEALGVKRERSRSDGSMVIVPVLGKGNKARDVRISANLYAEIVAAYSGETWLFETESGRAVDRVYAYRRISEAVLKVTGKRFSPHCLRHTFASRMLEKTGKLKAVSSYLGHASAAITLDMYTHEDLSDAELLS
jgi:integrase